MNPTGDNWEMQGDCLMLFRDVQRCSGMFRDVQSVQMSSLSSNPMIAIRAFQIFEIYAG